MGFALRKRYPENYCEVSLEEQKELEKFGWEFRPSGLREFEKLDVQLEGRICTPRLAQINSRRVFEVVNKNYLFSNGKPFTIDAVSGPNKRSGTDSAIALFKRHHKAASEIVAQKELVDQPAAGTEMPIEIRIQSAMSCR